MTTPGRSGRRSRARVLSLTLAIVLVASACRFHPADTWSPDAVATRIQINALLDDADAADTAGDAEAAAAARAAASTLECEVFLCDTSVGTTTILHDPTLGGGFFDAPWPSDTRLHPDGTIDLTGFPGRDTIPIADLVLGRGEAATLGFGTNSAIYFRASGALDPATLPLAAATAEQRRPGAVLLNLDDPAAPPVPLLADVKAAGTPRRPSNLVALLPYPGHPLDPSTRYAAAVFDGVLDASGDRLAPAPILDALDGPAPQGVAPATWTALRQDRDDTAEAVRGRTLWHPSEIVAFTAFTTQDTTGEMAAIAAAVEALPDPQLLSRQPDAVPCSPGGTSRSTARVALPVWQAGTRPFVNDGGGIVVGADDRAVQQGVELGAGGTGVLLDVAIPCGPAPEAGWPILLWMRGTGGSAQAAPITELGPDVPYAVFSIAPLYSGDRLVVAPPPFNTSDFQFFNHSNPLAARTNALQQAGDVLWLERLARTFALQPGEAGGGVEGHFDTSTVVMGGHSQGATTLPLTLAFAPDVSGAFLSASGAGLYHSIVYRGDVRALVDALIGAAPDELDVFHPYPQVLQTFAEVADPANYASAITADLAIYGGLRDGCTSIEVSTHLAQALGVPISNPQTRQPLFGPEILTQVPGYTSPFEPAVVTTPVSQNLSGGRTGVVVQVDSGHFGARAYPQIGRSFIDSIAAGGPTVIDPGSTPAVAPGTQCPRFGPPPVP